MDALIVDPGMREVLGDWLATRDSDTDALRHATVTHIKDLKKVIFALVDECGAEIHDDGCPEDDTCDCKVAKIVNEALIGLSPL